MPAGYSGTPLGKKLGIKESFKIMLVNKPPDYLKILGELPPGVKQIKKGNPDLIHLFTKSRKELKSELSKFLKIMEQDGMIWVSWPKKASGKATKIETDITEDIIREVALQRGSTSYGIGGHKGLRCGRYLVRF
jgi:hypothetical protein